MISLKLSKYNNHNSYKNGGIQTIIHEYSQKNEKNKMKPRIHLDKDK